MRFEKGGLGFRHRLDETGRHFTRSRGGLQRIPGGFGAADQPDIGLADIRCHMADRKPVRYQERCLAGGIAHQPGELFDHQHLVDDRVVVIDGCGDLDRKLVEDFDQCRGIVHELLAEFRPA